MKSKIVVAALGLLLSVQATIAQTPNPPRGKKWVKVNELSDEFNGNKIDGNKWFDYHPFWRGRPPSQFKKGNATVSGGFLRLKSTLQRSPESVRNPLSDIWVDAAAVVSKKKNARPGYYYECSMKTSSLSMTSSFWFRVGRFSEIDVIEHVGAPTGSRHERNRQPRLYHSNTHYYGKHNGVRNVSGESRLPGNGRDNFYTYGFWWKSPKELIFYLNGKQAHKIIPARDLDENLHMVFDTEVFPFAQAGIPTFGLPLPKNLNDNSKNTMLVNWVRTYKLENGTSPNPTPAPTPTPVTPPTQVGNGNAPINTTISLRKSGGDRKFVTGENNGSALIARGSTVRGWEKFRVESHPKGGIALKALSNNKYVQVPDRSTDAPVRPNGSFKGDWERFQWKSKGNGKVAFKSIHTGKWLQAPWLTDNTVIRAVGPRDLGWETFDWKIESGNKILSDLTEGLTAYPNPAIDEITVNGTSDIDVKVYDLNGALAPTTITGSTNSITINTSSLTKGVYFIETSAGKKIKFIKQ
ncbi:T9SS type A sorting domain-containing protein [Aquimarina agarivorans]|uniref:T9SS type A sorting domain-containing protein n=1 Tax=Aquimarina agarivorans TaxID=980584 RepID=UPI000248E6A2|nr:T9SS type A sorting domain-containing protein [Aquimarina agarivorans]